MNLTVIRDDALGPDALAMIGESEAEQAALYPPEVRYAFSPAQLTAAQVRFFVAYQEDRPVGCGGLAICGTTKRFGELKRIFVTRSARGRGIARQIIRKLEDHAIGEGLEDAPRDRRSQPGGPRAL